MASSSGDETTEYLLHISNLSLIATSAKLLEFLEAMGTCYFEHTSEGISTRECYVHIPDKKSADEALKKNGTDFMSRPVAIIQSSETVASLQAKKSQTKVTRVSPFGKGKSVTEIEDFVKKRFKKISKVDVEKVDSGNACEHKVAIVTFDDYTAAATAMETNKKWSKNQRLSKHTLKDETEIDPYLDGHRKDMFWA